MWHLSQVFIYHKCDIHPDSPWSERNLLVTLYSLKICSMEPLHDISYNHYFSISVFHWHQGTRDGTYGSSNSWSRGEIDWFIECKGDLEMFSAIRRHFQSSQPSQATSPRPTPLPQSLQEKFQRGITANMRILICGKKKSGKTSLLNRLKGKPHSIEYNPTKEVVKAGFH